MDYITILSLMESGREYTAYELGVAPASMTAMVRRSMVEKIEGKPCRYRKPLNNYFQRLDNFTNKCSTEYFIVWLKDSELGMMCRYKNGILYNCWDENWNERIPAIQYIKSLDAHSNRIDFMK